MGQPNPPNPAPPQPQPAPPVPQPQPGPAPNPAPQPAPPQNPAPPAPVQYPPMPPVQVPPVPNTMPAQFPPPPAGHQPATGNGQGYPENTPLEQMTAEQREAYWRAQSRKWEGRAKSRDDYDDLKAKAQQFDQLSAANQTDHQRAITEAAATARQQAMVEAGGRLVDAWVKAAAAGRLDEERVNALLSGLDRRAFVNATTGEVDTDRVVSYVQSIAPVAPVPMPYPVAPTAPGQQPVTGAQPGYAAPSPGQPVYPPATGQPVYPAAVGQPIYPAQPVYPTYPGMPGYQAGYPVAAAGAPGQVPDFGQGQQQTAKPSGLAAGKAVAAARFGEQIRSNTTAGQAGNRNAASPAQQ